MEISPHFSFEELSSTSVKIFKEQNRTEASLFKGKLTALAYYLLEPVRKLLGAPLIITSAYRCAALNDYIKGVGNSQHLLGEAADFVVFDMDSRAAFDKIRNCPFIHFGQLILEPGWIHISLGAPFRDLGACGEVLVK